MSCHEGGPLSDFFGSFGVVQPLPISLFGSFGSASGFLRIGALLPTLALLVAFLATILAFCAGFSYRFSAPPRLPLLPKGADLLSASPLCLLPCSRTPPLLRTDSPRLPRPRGLSFYVYNILLSVCVLIDASTWFFSTSSIDCKSNKDDVFSLVQTAVWNAPNFDANPQRQICTISPSWTFTSMERESRRYPLSWRFSQPSTCRVVAHFSTPV